MIDHPLLDHTMLAHLMPGQSIINITIKIEFIQQTGVGLKELLVREQLTQQLRKQKE